MSESIKTANEGVDAIYTQEGTVLPKWLMKLKEASGGDSTGILSFNETKPAIDAGALASFLSEIDRIEASGRTNTVNELTQGGLGIAGEVMAVRRTLEQMLKGGEIPREALLNFATYQGNLRFPIGMTQKPYCPSANRQGPVNIQALSHFGWNSEKMPVLAGAVHETRDAGSYEQSIPYDNSAPVPTPFSTPLSLDLSNAVGRYLRTTSTEKISSPNFSVKAGAHWTSDALVERKPLQLWLANFMER